MRGFVRPLFALALIAGLALPWSVPGNHGDIFAFALPSEAQAQSRPRSAWRPVGAARGTGTVICNRSGNAFACFGIRCGKGRGTEFLFLFNRGDYGEQPVATLTVDGKRSWNQQFTEVVKGQELVAPFSASADSDGLVGALKAGNALVFNPGGFEHRFMLKKSSREIDRVLAQCPRDGTNQPLVSQNSPDRPAKVAANSQDLSWRENDTEQSYVARIREAAIPYGGSCDEEQAIIERLQRDIEVSVDGDEVRAGETISVNWSGNTLKRRIPAYLMVATDAPVRFKGSGFYALTPKAIGPFGMEAFQEKTRAIVPLFGKGAKRTGEIRIEPVLAGRIDLETSVVGYLRKCGTELFESSVIASIRAKPASRPVIDLDDSLESASPEKYLISSDNSRLLDVRDDGTWRLLSTKGRQVIAERVGTLPRFSVTGRFVVAETEKGAEILDALDGKVILEDMSYSISWQNQDSFALFDGGRWGAFDGRNMLVPQQNYQAGGGSHAASGRDTPTRFDQENAIQVAFSSEFLSIRRLGDPEERTDLSGLEEASARREMANAIQTYANTVAQLPTNWEFVGGERAVHMPFTTPDGKESPGEGAFRTTFMKTYVQPDEIAVQQLASLKLVADQGNLETSLARSLSPGITDTQSTDLANTIALLGMDALEPTGADDERSANADQYISHDRPYKPQQELGREVSPLIISENPKAKSLLVEPDEYWGCDGPAFDEARKYVVKGKPLWLTQLVCTGGNGLFYNSVLQVFHPELKDGAMVPDLNDPENDIGTSCFGDLSYCPVQSSLFDDRYLVIWSADSRAVAIFDTTNLKVTFKKFQLPRGDVLSEMRLSEDLRHLIQTNTDGTFFVHRIADGETVLEGRVVDDEVVVWTPDLRFDATAEGAHFVNLRFPGQIGQYTFQQFDSRLRVPGLMKQVLSGDYEPMPVEIGVPPQLSGSVVSAGERITGTVTPESLGDLRSVRVYQDGVLSDEVLALENGVVIEIDVARLPGARWVSLVAVDEEGLVSLPVGRDLGPETQKLAKVRLLAVGVDEYDDEEIFDLNFAKSDASRLLESVSRLSGKSVELVSSKLLSDSDASPQAVLAAAEELVASSRPGEQLVFFFAGHGTPGEDGRYYLATSNTDLSDISGTALAWDKLSAVLRKSEARMTVFIDSCHSGSAGTDFFASNNDAVSGILKDLPSGLTVFAASKGREESLEDPAVGGGYFTAAVADVIAGNRGEYDLNQNGVIEVSELYVGVKRQVTGQTAGRQTPWLARNQMVGDFALF